MNSWQTCAITSAFFAAWVVIFSKFGVAHIPSNMATLIRTIVISFFLIALISVRNEWTSPFLLHKKDFLCLFLSGIATGLSWVFYFRALQLGPATGVISLDKLSLVFTALLSIFLLKENLGWHQWSGVFLITGGMLLLSWK